MQAAAEHMQHEAEMQLQAEKRQVHARYEQLARDKLAESTRTGRAEIEQMRSQLRSEEEARMQARDAATAHYERVARRAMADSEHETAECEHEAKLLDAVRRKSCGHSAKATTLEEEVSEWQAWAQDAQKMLDRASDDRKAARSKVKQAEERCALMKQEMKQEASQPGSKPDFAQQASSSSSFRAQPNMLFAGIRLPQKVPTPPGMQSQAQQEKKNFDIFSKLDSPRQDIPVRTKGNADDSSDESEEEKFTRQRTSVKTIELALPPAAGGLRT